jgi:hypothetical protein
VAVVCNTVLAADVTRRWRVRIHARVCAGTSPSRRRAPQHARALARKVRLGLWPLFLRRTSTLRTCRPRLHGLAVGVCFAHAVTEKGTLSSWSASAHLATGRRFHTHTRLCPNCGCLVRRHPWRRPELRRGLRCTAYLRPTPSLSSSRSPLRACAPKCTPAHASLRRLTREGTRPPAAYRRRADAAVPAPASTSQRRSPPFLG